MTPGRQDRERRVALIGGEEFAPGFEDVHAGLLAEAGGQGRVAFLPTCAADDGPESVDYWCDQARRQLSALGATVETPRVVDAASADDERYARAVADADWIYFGGGYPHVAMGILSGTRVMAALNAAVQRGVLVSGSSGGAMLLCARSIVITPEHAATIGRFWEQGAPDDWSPPPPVPLDCLAWVPRSECAPHFNRRLLPRGWRAGELLLDGFTLIGIDEQTVWMSRGDGRWEVRGRGAVTLVRKDAPPARYRAGDGVAW